MMKLYQMCTGIKRCNQQRSFRSFVQVTIVALVSLFFLCIMPPAGYSAPLHSDPTTKTVAFETIFEKLATEGKVCFVFEGVPLHADTPATELNTALKKVNLLTERIELVANTFDYEPELLNRHTYLLRKRYSTTEDFPCVTYGEMLAFMRGCNRVTLPYQGEGPFEVPRIAAMHFAASLTKQELKAIQNINGVPVDQFSEEQQVLIRRAALQFFADMGLHSIQEDLAGLEALQSKNSYFKWIKFQGETLFGCEGPFGPTGIKWSFPLSGHYMQGSIGAIINTKTMRTSINGKLQPPLPLDPTAPTETDYYEYAHPIRYNSATTFAKALNGIAAMDKALAEKPVCIIGKDYLPKSEYPLALSRLYKLLLIHQHDGTQRVAIRAPRFSTSIARLSDDIRLLVPDPLMRSAKIRDLNPNLPVRNDHFQSYYKPIVRRLRVRILPRMPNPNSKPIPITEITEEERRIFGLAFVTGEALDGVVSLCLRKVPECISNPQNTYVRAQIAPSGEMLSIDIGHRDYKTGEFIFDVGGGMPKVYISK